MIRVSSLLCFACPLQQLSGPPCNFLSWNSREVDLQVLEVLWGHVQPFLLSPGLQLSLARDRLGQEFPSAGAFRVLSLLSLLPIHSGTQSWPCWAACAPLCFSRSWAILLETIWLHGGWGLWRTAALVPWDSSCKRHCTADLRIGPCVNTSSGGSSHTFSKRITPAEAPHHPLLPFWQPSEAPPLLFHQGPLPFLFFSFFSGSEFFFCLLLWPYQCKVHFFDLLICLLDFFLFFLLLLLNGFQDLFPPLQLFLLFSSDFYFFQKSFLLEASVHMLGHLALVKVFLMAVQCLQGALSSVSSHLFLMTLL